ncbi:MAG TPA: MoxR family ATPase [Dehalococcoidia bacterium]|nr:MoxR family ATPase [Dehalococcoidia bacterium]
MLQNSVGIERVALAAAAIKANIGRVLVGKGNLIELVLAAVFSGGHVLIEDVPGIGKTTLARSLASSLGCIFKRIQCTPDLMPSDITGVHYFNQKSSEFEFRPGPIMAQVVLADEINRATPRTQSALLEAMAEHQVTIDETTFLLPAPFMVIATQNPIELEGTFPLPEAQLDRFLIRLRMGYPDEAEEEEMLVRFEGVDPLSDLKAVSGAQEVVEFQNTVQRVYVDPVLRTYLIRIVQATRKHPEVELGASPRASMGLYRCAQALSAIRGREYVTPDEIKTLAPFTLAHRVILQSQARLRERSPDSIIGEILNQIEVPV